eukprot:scaffold1130_cov195-Pinguiococcus_pyrenoidosus.AAC.107
MAGKASSLCLDCVCALPTYSCARKRKHRRNAAHRSRWEKTQVDVKETTPRGVKDYSSSFVQALLAGFVEISTSTISQRLAFLQATIGT